MDLVTARELVSDLAELEREKTEVLVHGQLDRLQELIHIEQLMADRLEQVPEPSFPEELEDDLRDLEALRERNRLLLEQALAFVRYSLHLITGEHPAGVYTSEGLSGAKGDRSMRVNTQA